jgi:hypothetical protein
MYQKVERVANFLYFIRQIVIFALWNQYANYTKLAAALQAATLWALSVQPSSLPSAQQGLRTIV